MSAERTIQINHDLQNRKNKKSITCRQGKTRTHYLQKGQHKKSMFSEKKTRSLYLQKGQFKNVVNSERAKRKKPIAFT